MTMIHKKTSSDALSLLFPLSLILLCHVDVGFSLLSSSSSSPSTGTRTPARRYNNFKISSTVDSSISSSSTIDNDDVSKWGFIADTTNNDNNSHSSSSSNSNSNKDKTWAEITNEMTDVSAPVIPDDLMDWVQDDVDEIIDEIHNAFSTLDVNMYDTSFLASEQPKKRSFLDTSRSSFQQQQQDRTDRKIQEQIDNQMDDEIAMLVRCNEQPESLLIEEGRALPPLSQEEKDDMSQLVSINVLNNMEATDFLKDAISKMFHQHAVPSHKDGILSMDTACIASWMTKSLKDDELEGKVSRHDKRVLKTMSEYSTYGTGRLVESNFQRLYLSCIVGNKQSSSRAVSSKRHLEMRKPYRDAVWRDIRAHGILSPVETERSLLSKEILELTTTTTTTTVKSNTNNNRVDPAQMFVDECEILDWGSPEIKKTNKIRRRSNNDIGNGDGNEDSPNSGRSSHMSVEMANDNKTPLRIRDGDFVFIDEESCIGCTVCSTMASSSFSMLEDSGRARSYFQRSGKDVDQAVDACPVSCMHRVSYDELKQLETVRDEGDGRTDHKHLGHRRGHIPLHVAGMDSDVNRRPSWYHTSKETCVSKGCKSGCFDCPSYSTPGENPIFVTKHKNSVHIRALQLIENGEADIFRKFVEL